MATAYHYQNTFRDSLADEFSQVLGALYNPLEMPGLAVWHDGADLASISVVNDQITVWRDKSGNGYNLGPVAGEVLPSIGDSLQNGRTGVFFDYSEKAMLESAYSASASGSLSAFVVAKRIDSSTAYGGGSVYKSILSIGRPDGSSVEIGKFNIAEDRDSGKPLTNAHKVSAVNHSSGLLMDGKAHVLTSVLDYGVEFVLSGFADGVLAEADDRTSVVVADELTPLQVGGSTSASSRRFWGTIYEILLFERALEPQERTVIESYLSLKWAVALQTQEQT